MALTIQTTGLEDYAPGGQARIKMLNIGGPGAGKTRLASYFPKPIYADCEKGLASVADRKVPYARVITSQDMLDLLAMLKQECMQPFEQRKYQTVVIDTLDAFQRKVKDEWMVKNNASAFSGWEAWGFLNARMQMLLVRLLNLDMNVIVNVHYKDKTSKDDASGKETHELMLQLQGETADTAFNDFDLVGWSGVYWEAEGGERVKKRGITFTATPDKPFLKDRLHVTPKWLPITFSDRDYLGLFERINARIADLSEGEVVGEVPTDRPEPARNVVVPGGAGGGAIPGAADKVSHIGYDDMDKPTLGALCRERGIATTVDGVPIKGNTLKSELKAALRKADEDKNSDAPPTAPAAQAPAATGPEQPAAEDSARAPATEPATQEQAAPVSEPVAVKQPGVANARRTRVVDLDNGTKATMDVATGELVDEHDGAVQVAKDVLGAVPLDASAKSAPSAHAEPAPAVKPAAKPVTKPTAKAASVCSVCQKDLSNEPNPDIVKLSWIKFRETLCEEHFQARTGKK